MHTGIEIGIGEIKGGMGGMHRRGMGHLGTGTVVVAEGENGSTSEVENGAMAGGERKTGGREGDDKGGAAVACLTTRTERNAPLYGRWSQERFSLSNVADCQRRGFVAGVPVYTK